MNNYIGQNIRRGDIYFAIKSRPSKGSVQNASKGRPVIIVSNDMNNEHSETLEVVFLTTAPKKDLPTHVEITSSERKSVALCEQVQTISKKELGHYISTCTDEEMVLVDKAISISLGLENLPQSPTRMGNEDNRLFESALEKEKSLTRSAIELKAKYELLSQMYDRLLNSIVDKKEEE